MISDQFISYHFCFAFQAPRAVVETVPTMQALNVYAMENYGIGKKYVCFLSLFCACLFLFAFFLCRTICVSCLLAPLWSALAHKYEERTNIFSRTNLSHIFQRKGRR